MATHTTPPLPHNVDTLIRRYGEMEYLSGRETARRLLRLSLGLSAASDENSIERNAGQAEREAVEVMRDNLIDAIRDAL